MLDSFPFTKYLWALSTLSTATIQIQNSSNLQDLVPYESYLCCVLSHSVVSALFATLWTGPREAHQASLSVEFSGDLLDPVNEPAFLASPTLPLCHLGSLPSPYSSFEVLNHLVPACFSSFMSWYFPPLFLTISKPQKAFDHDPLPRKLSPTYSSIANSYNTFLRKLDWCSSYNLLYYLLLVLHSTSYNFY